MGTVTFREVDVDGIKVFYREAGPKDAPTILLLHGFPTAGHMFRDLIPQLADRFRLVAPDLPGFGQSDMPARSAFIYTFENIANVINRFAGVMASIASRSTSSTMAHPSASASPFGIRIASPQSS